MTMKMIRRGMLGLAASSMASGMALAQTNPSEPSPGQLDMTGQGGTPPKEYVVLPVPRGELQVAKDTRWKDSTVKSPTGKKLGTLERLIIDTKEGKIEYGVVALADSGQLVPLALSAFNIDRKDGEITLNATEEQLGPGTTSASIKDVSPQIQELVGDISKERHGKGKQKRTRTQQ